MCMYVGPQGRGHLVTRRLGPNDNTVIKHTNSSNDNNNNNNSNNNVNTNTNLTDNSYHYVMLYYIVHCIILGSLIVGYRVTSTCSAA